MIRGIPTNTGIHILNSQLREQVQTYALVGKEMPKDNSLEEMLLREDLNFDEVREFIFHTASIDIGYFDEHSILTYEINLVSINTDKYMYGILLLDMNNQVIASLPTPQVILVEGVGGLMTIKLPIKGEINEVVFVSSDYVSRDEFNVLKSSLKPPKVDIPALVEQITPLIQEKKDFLSYAHTIVDSIQARVQYLLIAQKEFLREIDKLGEYRLFVRNALPKGYKPLGAILPIWKYPIVYYYLVGTNVKVQDNCPSGYFKLPKGGFYTKGTNNPSLVGAFEREGLPNITGGVYRIAETFHEYGWTSGAFAKEGGHNSGGTPKSVDWSNAAAFNFNASRCSAIYGRTNSVEVNHNLLLEGIYCGGGGNIKINPCVL